jgi:hypothetical protein
MFGSKELRKLLARNWEEVRDEIKKQGWENLYKEQLYVP